MFGIINTSLEISEVPRIDPDIKARWIAALRGDYHDKQGQNALKDPDGNFCCLGVYCDMTNIPSHVRMSTYTLPDQDGDPRDRRRIQTYMTVFGIGEESSQSTIPSGYRIPWHPDTDEYGCFEWGSGFYGEEYLFRSISPDGKDIIPSGTNWSLPNLNDSGFNFDQIADIIDYFL